MNGKYLIIFLSCFVFPTLNSAPLRFIWSRLTTEFDLQLKASPESGSAEQQQEQQWQVFA